MSDAVTMSLVTGCASVIASSLAAWISHRTHKIVNSSNELWKEMAKEKYELVGADKERQAESARQTRG